MVMECLCSSRLRQGSKRPSGKPERCFGNSGHHLELKPGGNQIRNELFDLKAPINKQQNKALCHTHSICGFPGMATVNTSSFGESFKES